MFVGLGVLQLVECGSGISAVVRRVPVVTIEGAPGPEEGVEDFLSRGEVGLCSPADQCGAALPS